MHEFNNTMNLTIYIELPMQSLGEGLIGDLIVLMDKQSIKINFGRRIKAYWGINVLFLGSLHGTDLTYLLTKIRIVTGVTSPFHPPKWPNYDWQNMSMHSKLAQQH